MNTYLSTNRILRNQTDYYDPRNSFLTRSSYRRIGIPLRSDIVYMEVGRRCGCASKAWDFPATSSARSSWKAASWWWIPFHRGQLLGWEIPSDGLRPPSATR